MHSSKPDPQRRWTGCPWVVAIAWLALCGGCSDPAPASSNPVVDGAAEPDAGGPEEGPDAAGPSPAPEASADGDGAVDAPPDIASQCPSPVDTVDGCVLTSDGNLIVEPLLGAMTVSSIDHIAVAACRFTGFDDGASPPSGATRATILTLDAGDGTRRNIVMRATGLPPDLFHVGETIDLSLKAWEDIAAFYATRNQTFVLARNGQPVFVASTLNLYQRPIPDLAGTGIQLADDGVACRGAESNACYPQDHRLRISYDGASAAALPGQTVRLGAATVVVESLRERVGPSCDGKGFTQLAAFWSNQH